MTIAILIDPLDVLFCRDGRPIVAGEGASAGATLPWPQVVAGAVRTAVLKQRGAFQNKTTPDPSLVKKVVSEVSIRGPLLYDRKNGKNGRPFIPCPADVVAAEKSKHGKAHSTKLIRLNPLPENVELPGWNENKPSATPLLRPLWHYEAPKNNDQIHRARAWHTQMGWITWDGFESWVNGDAPNISEHRQSDDLFFAETRTQVSIDSELGTALEGKLFTTHYLRLKSSIALYVEIDGADDLVDIQRPSVLTLGGDRRLCQIERTELVRWPKRPSGPAVLLGLTPTIIKDIGASYPSALAKYLTGCAVSGHDAISGWDLERHCPKPTRYACRAGAVWHLASHITEIPKLNRDLLDQDRGFGWLAVGTYRNPLL